MQTILIPSDFSLTALDCIPSLCKQYQNQQLNFIFIHMFKLSDSITDLLMLSRRNREYEHISDAFREKSNSLKKQYPQIKSIGTEFFYGSTVSMFKNYLEANEIDAILDVSDCTIGKINKTSIDPSVMVMRSGINVIRVEAVADEEPVFETELMAEPVLATASV